MKCKNCPKMQKTGGGIGNFYVCGLVDLLMFEESQGPNNLKENFDCAALRVLIEDEIREAECKVQKLKINRLELIRFESENP